MALVGILLAVHALGTQLQLTLLTQLQEIDQAQTVLLAAAALTLVPGARRALGTEHERNTGFYEAVQRMMINNPHQFYVNFRMLPSTFKWFAQRLWDHKHPPLPLDAPRKRSRPPCRSTFDKRLLMTIWFLATGCTYRELNATWGVTADHRDLLIDDIAAMAYIFIRWPTGSDFLAACHAFSQLRGLPNCCGAIDGTFIRIDAPLSQINDPAEYNSYKKFYALQCLAVALPNYIITYLHTGEPGSRADAHVLQRSSLFTRILDFIPKGFYLLGDGGFGLLAWLIIPFAARHFRHASDLVKSTRNMFNRAQKSSRVVVEQTFGILKGRWVCLRKGLKCRLR